jgi:peptidyl-prolyl cis-trans isomerase SurA
MTKLRFLSPVCFRLPLSALLVLSLGLSGGPVLAQGLKPSSQLGLPSSGVLGPNPGGGQHQADFIVAVVNSEPITNNEVRARVTRADQQLAQQGKPLPPRAEFTHLMLERIIAERSQLQLAKELGIEVTDSVLDAAVQNVAQQNQLSVESLRQRLKVEGLSFTGFRNDLRNELLLTRVRERELDARAKVSEQEIDQFLQGQDDMGDANPLEINLAQVLVAVPENATTEQRTSLRARAELVLARARSGADFGALAKEFSSASGDSEGQMGLLPTDRYPQLFLDATQNLAIGDVSDVIRSDAGFHVLKLIEKKRAGMPASIVTQTRARHILLRPGAQLSQGAALVRLADFRKQIAAGQADFAALAREFSQDGSAKEGGDLGWANPGMFVPEFEASLNKLAPGEMGEPLVSRFGVHLIQVLEHRNIKRPEREQREIVRGLLREKKFSEAYVAWAQEVRGRAYVDYREAPQ